MIIKDSRLLYGFVTKFLHWIIALLVFFMLTIGFLLNTFSQGSHADFFYDLHKEIGLTVLFLMILRIIWRFFNTKPALPPDSSNVEIFFSKWSHHLFYIALILMPINGWIMSVASGYAPNYFGFFTLNLPVEKSQHLTNFMSDVHEFLAWTLISLISIHILAALKHYLYNQDTVLQRMLFPNK